ncbi:hypothetical protein QF004_002544 [Chryseobacterium sp. MDT2-18]|uniref:Uncharacterized protein n=1 Tax=Chryseobacterium salivictor TaxID=2547600 RepID=A0A4P6ZFV0_9FLAO|nr:hypothetical protein [Chryseobacterium sp. MDT2-18]QBO58481.1 hypothetical protein NBC122_01666 [Chryseobacterium salivictor]
MICALYPYSGAVFFNHLVLRKETPFKPHCDPPIQIKHERMKKVGEKLFVVPENWIKKPFGFSPKDFDLTLVRLILSKSLKLKF